MRQTIILPAIAVTVLSLLAFAVSPQRPVIKEMSQLRQAAFTIFPWSVVPQSRF
ncbi:MAG: hypothetical protein JST76_03375 [Bacteroidetes bacterium]|nr:hypothetical protein [Bacteroidota bacterium]